MTTLRGYHFGYYASVGQVTCVAPELVTSGEVLLILRAFRLCQQSGVESSRTANRLRTKGTKYSMHRICSIESANGP